MTKTIYTWVKNGPSVQSTPATSTITLDTITPSNPQWISMAPPQANTDYNGWKMRVLNYGVSGLSTNLADWNITSLNGGTVTILSVNSDGTITVNYHSPSGVGGDTLQINGKSGTGKPFSTTIDTDIFG